MTDVDFDELDKAVNSILSTDSSKPKESSDSKSTNESTASASSPVEIIKDKPDASSAKNESPTSERPVITRTGGRFMDVVHPSSDMKSPKPSDRVPPKPVSREAKTLNPPSDMTSAKSNLTKSNDVMVSPNDLPMKLTQEAKTEVSKEKDSYVMPDPIDISDNLEKKPEDGEKAPDTPNSPFLPDAKVEKRPLGAYSAGLSSIEDKPTAPEEPKNETEPFDTPMPAELDPKLLSIESGDADEVVRSKTTEPSINQQSSVSSTGQLVEPKSADSEQPTSGSIYDTKEYHTPLNHPAKKSSGWMMVIWSILIIAVCGGIAAAVYLFFLSN